MLNNHKTLYGILVTMALTAAPEPSPADEEANRVCSSVGDMAALVMELRQNGASEWEAHAKLEDAKGDNKDVYELSYYAVKRAYEMPHLEHEELKQKMIEHYREFYKKRCIEAIARWR